MNFPVQERSYWAPLYFEPLPASEERFCVAIVVISTRGADVITAPGIARLQCLFPQEGNFIISAVEQVVEIFKEHLEIEENRLGIMQSGRCNTQSLPISNFYCGKFLFSKGSNHELIAQNALELCSSFKSPFSTKISQGKTDRVVCRIRNLVVATHRHLSKCFNVQASTYTQEIQPHFGFIGSNLAANIGRLSSNKLSEHFPHFQAKAMDLERLRENQEKNLFDVSLQKFSLLALVVRPEEWNLQKQNDHEDRLQDTLDALQEIARRRELEFVPSEEVSQLSQSLIDMEEHR